MLDDSLSLLAETGLHHQGASLRKEAGALKMFSFLQENFAGVKPRPYRAKFSVQERLGLSERKIQNFPVPKTRHSSEERKAAWL